jgi:hypothetical protein
MEYTPGPWEVAPDPENDDSFLIEETNEGAIVAQVIHCCSGEWTEANAHLITAAPDMYLALKEAEVVLKEQNNGKCLASVLAAIAKAESRDWEGEKWALN